MNIELESEPADPNQVRGAHSRFASPGFFAAMGINLVAGRDFTVDDRRGSQPVAVVNRAFVRRSFRTRILSPARSRTAIPRSIARR